MHASYSVIDPAPPTIGSVHFFRPFSTMFVKGLATPRLLEIWRRGERQSPDGNKRPRGTPNFLTPVRPKSASS